MRSGQSGGDSPALLSSIHQLLLGKEEEEVDGGKMEGGSSATLGLSLRDAT